MSAVISPLFPVTLALYAVAFTLYCVAVGQSQPAPAQGPLGRWARRLLLLGCLVQAADIGWSCAHGVNPASGTRETAFFASFLISAAYLLLTLRQAIPVVATLTLPITMALGIAGRMIPSEAPQAVSALRAIHIVTASLGVAVFSVAAGVAVIYLLTERQLKRHHLGQLGRRGPALQTLDLLGRRCIVLGFPVFTVALISGAVFFDRLSGGLKHPLLALRHPQYVLSLSTWAVYAGLLVSRVTGGLRGRRAAYLTLGGFLMIVSVLLIYLLRGVWQGGSPS